MKHLVWVFYFFVVLQTSFSQEIKALYHYEVGRSYRYSQEIKSDIEQEVQGQTMNANVDGQVVVSMFVESMLGEQSYSCKNTIEYALVKFNSPFGNQTLGEKLKGHSVSIEIQRNGKVKKRDSTEMKNSQLSMITSRAEEFLPLLNGGLLTVGSTWTEESTDTLKSRGSVIEKK